MVLSIGRHFEFEAAHYLPGYDGVCSKIHGHTYKLVVELKVVPVSSAYLEDMIMDFKNFKTLIQNAVLQILDHSYLNEIEGLEHPTVENLIVFILRKLQDNSMVHLACQEKGDIRISQLKLYETSSCFAKIIL